MKYTKEQLDQFVEFFGAYKVWEQLRMEVLEDESFYIEQRYFIRDKLNTVDN